MTALPSQPDSLKRRLAWRQASLRHEAIKRCTPSWRMLLSVIGGLCGCLGFVLLRCENVVASDT
jgi:hypothetical protein